MLHYKTGKALAGFPGKSTIKGAPQHVAFGPVLPADEERQGYTLLDTALFSPGGKYIHRYAKPC